MPFSKFNQKRFNKPIPIKEGETYEVTIENIGEKGDGIAKIEGYVIIIPNTKKGERIKMKVNAIRGKVSFGEVVERLGTKEGSGEEESEDSGSDESDEEEGEESEDDESGEEESEPEEAIEEEKLDE